MNDFGEWNVAERECDLIGSAALDAADFIGRIVGEASRDVRTVRGPQPH